MLTNNSCKATVNILAFGDSNTWGYQPNTGLRYARNQRWSSLLDSLLGPNFHVTENGLNGRTTTLDEPGRADRNGRKLLPVILEMANPLDIVIMMLGTNDLKPEFKQTPQDIGHSIVQLCQLVQASEFTTENCHIILVAPTLVTCELGPKDEALESCYQRSTQLSSIYQQVAESLEIEFFDAASIVHTTDSDGVHWESYQHRDFAKALCLFIQGLRLESSL